MTLLKFVCKGQSSSPVKTVLLPGFSCTRPKSGGDLRDVAKSCNLIGRAAQGTSRSKAFSSSEKAWLCVAIYIDAPLLWDHIYAEL